MERIHAYRLLGLREGAPQGEIDAAYEERQRKYKSQDYQDEPEYAARKIRELQEAYMLLGGSAPKAAAAAAGKNAAEKLQSFVRKLELPSDGPRHKPKKKAIKQNRKKPAEDDGKKIAGFVLTVILMIISFLLSS